MIRRPASSSSASRPAAPAAPLSPAGIAFFSSLCALTFGLGCWQSTRYYQKIDLLEEMAAALSLPPASATANPPPHRRVRVVGTYAHEKTVLVGPRRAPGGAGQTEGLAPSPLGYFVVTPMEVGEGNVLLVNRGWMPIGMIPRKEAGETFGGEGSRWYMPRGTTEAVGISAKEELGGRFSPVHEIGCRRLLWMDRSAMAAAAGIADAEGLLLLTETDDEQDDDGPRFPLRPSTEDVGMTVAMAPEQHAGYAVTWFGLSGAGILMTRRLLGRGRG